MTYKPKKCRVLEVKGINERVKLIRVKTKINPKPGQFFEVSLPGIGECPLASCSFNKNYVDILLRDAGGTTSQLFKLEKGDSLYIRGPYGKGFPLAYLEEKDLVMVAGGTGIAPITSLIEYVEKNRDSFGEIKIYFGFRDEDRILLKERVDRWKKKFDLTLCLDRPGKGWEERFKQEKGYVCDILKEKTISFNGYKGLLCGPEQMMESTTKELNKKGLANDKIYWSLERRMECGVGSCGRCLIRDLYTCKDGPVFKYSKIKPGLDKEKK